MSMSTHVFAVRDLDGRFKKMMDLKLACDDLGVSYPAELVEYFEHPNESEGYLREAMETVELPEGLIQQRTTDDAEDIWEVDVTQLPEEVKKIRFVNSY